ncbi:MAG: hypothetical protein ACI31A_05670 [Candidatus Limisoma sp.]
MKKIFSLMLVLAAMLASCSQSDELLTVSKDAKEVTFSLTADGVEQTRAADALRYVMAIYDESETNVVLAETEFTTSSFAVRLDPGKYTCLFWADYGSENYDAANLKSVALKDAATNLDAYFAKQNITIEDGATIDVTLHRAVAKMVLKETDMLQPGSLKVTYAGCKGFNVSDGVGVNLQTFSQTISIENVIEATTDTPAEVGSFLMLANADERVVQDFKVQYQTATKTEPEKTITNVPVQANYVTNINGKYSRNVAQQFTIIVDDIWATPENEYDMIPYVTFSAESEQTFTMDFDPYEREVFTLNEGEYFEYSVGGGEWTRFTTTVSDIHFGGALGDLQLRGKSSQGTADLNSGRCTISFGTSGVLVDCTGDIRTLIDYKNYKSANTENAVFCGLFENNTLLMTAPELPAMKLSENCYLSMFAGCTSLISAPELPALTLVDGCYFCMFYNCSSLTTAPKLPATALANDCYANMFYNCTSLTTAPELPAATLTSNCYGFMFYGCTKLSEVKMLATEVSAGHCLIYWMEGAGTEAASRTLTLANQDVYNIISAKNSMLPNNWKQGAEGTTVIFKN